MRLREIAAEMLAGVLVLFLYPAAVILLLRWLIES